MFFYGFKAAEDDENYVPPPRQHYSYEIRTVDGVTHRYHTNPSTSLHSSLLVDRVKQQTDGVHVCKFQNQGGGVRFIPWRAIIFIDVDKD